ncbi:hypothetical protein E4T43_07843 [Aureobasidium subglaciale]|nr:hypothetical protein E4T43_07843 [Aureobasidium subglaciale]
MELCTSYTARAESHHRNSRLSPISLHPNRKPCDTWDSRLSITTSLKWTGHGEPLIRQFKLQNIT